MLEPPANTSCQLPNPSLYVNHSFNKRPLGSFGLESLLRIESGLGRCGSREGLTDHSGHSGSFLKLLEQKTPLYRLKTEAGVEQVPIG